MIGLAEIQKRDAPPNIAPTTVYAWREPVDMRNGIIGLAAMVEKELKFRTLQPGTVFMFVSNDRKRVKTLWWDGTGLCVFLKFLPQGTFASLWKDGATGRVTISYSDLRSFLVGNRGGRVALAPHTFMLRPSGAGGRRRGPHAVRRSA